MEQNFGKMEGVKFISDDIIIFAKTESELLERLKVVFKKIIELGMKLNKKKCVFAVSKLQSMEYHLTQIKYHRSKMPYSKRVTTFFRTMYLCIKIYQ